MAALPGYAPMNRPLQSTPYVATAQRWSLILWGCPVFFLVSFIFHVAPLAADDVATFRTLPPLVDSLTEPALVEPYEYPYTNPYLATVAGTPEALQAQPPVLKLRTAHLPVDAQRRIPRPLRYGRRFEYSYALQSGPAPLVFVIAGTGGYHSGASNRGLMQGFHAAGYHVVGITSPTHPAFIIAASRTMVPGNLAHDAADITRVMQGIVTALGKRHGRRFAVRGFHVAGYSLGGIHAAFIAHQDSTAQQFNFERVVLINSPVSLYSSISKLDRMLENIPGGVDNFNKYFSTIVRQISDAYTRSTSIEFNQDLVYAAFKANPPTNEDLAALIGSAFRLAAANMIFTADAMTDFGFIKPKEVRLLRRTSVADYLQVALRVGLTDYFHEFFWPYYQEEHPNWDRARFAAAQSLAHIEDYLRGANHIVAVHNHDDIILERNEIDFFARVFGDRVRIYPYGGHLGNLNQRDTVAQIVGAAAR